jgi:N-acyl-phosphatidylethanolamine-hydrolysing phospholipase D
LEPWALLVVLAFSAVTLPACRLGRATVRATSAFFSSPRPVTKTKHPVLPDARLAVIWVGHATALIQIDDKVVLTDPVFTSTVGQFSKRLVEPGIDPENLPPIDAVLVSHMHVDHLSLGSLEMIEKRVRALLLPRGGTAYVTDGWAFPSYELRTWQAWEKNGLRVTAVPVDHVGFRYGADEAWMGDAFTGYVVEYHGIKVYFPGDTAYDQRVFVETGQRFPNIDLALLPIGPLTPREFMQHYHLDAYQAVQAFIDLGAKRMVPIHYDTFVSSTDEPGDALRELLRAAKKWDLGDRQIVPLSIGERKVLIKAEPKTEGSKTEDAPSRPSTQTPPKPAPAPTTAPTSKPKDDDFD